MNTAWAATSSTNYGSLEGQHVAIPGTDTMFHAYSDGAGNLKVARSDDAGVTWPIVVTVDSTLGSFGDVMLNEPLKYDAVTGRLHVAYGRNVDDPTAKARLFHRYTDDLASLVTWSAEHTIDPGTAHSTLNSFYRVGLNADNGIVAMAFAYIATSGFVTDGLWRTVSTDGGATWSAPAKVYTGTVVQAGEPNMAGFSDGSVLMTWYDDGVNANGPGDLWAAWSRDHGATWDAAATRLTFTGGYGRPRPACDNGRWGIIANRPWNSAPTLSDVYLLLSNDNGATWGTPTKVGTASTDNLDHPDLVIVGNFLAAIWHDNAGSGGHGFIVSTDGGSTWTSPVDPFTVATTSDAPRLIATKNYLVATGVSGTNSLMTRNPMFSMIPGANTPILESGTGADENPLSAGGTFSQGSVIVGVTGTALRRLSNVIRRNQTTTGFQRSASYYNAVTFANSVEVFATQAVLGGETNVGIGDPSTKNGYDLAGLNSDFLTANGLTVNRHDAGSSVSLYLSGADGGSVAGDTIALQLVGTQVVVWQKRGGTWTEKARVTDNTYRSSLRLSLDLTGSASAGDQATNFGGGALTAPVSTSAPVASGTVGGVLSCAAGSWSMTPTRYAYRWQKWNGSAWVNITDATLPFYNSAADPASSYRCQVTASNAVGGTTAASGQLNPPVQTLASGRIGSAAAVRGGTPRGVLAALVSGRIASAAVTRGGALVGVLARLASGRVGATTAVRGGTPVGILVRLASGRVATTAAVRGGIFAAGSSLTILSGRIASTAAVRGGVAVGRGSARLASGRIASLLAIRGGVFGRRVVQLELEAVDHDLELTASLARTIDLEAAIK